MTAIREQARKAAYKADAERALSHTYSQISSVKVAADAASDVWAKDYEALSEMLADETIAPQKRIDSALVWIKETLR